MSSILPEAVTSTVNSAISTVTNAIYGSTENNETGGVEPVSGETGKGTVTDPYDKGNDPAMNPSTDSQPSATGPSKPDTTAGGSSAPSDGLPSTEATTAMHSTSDAPTSAPTVTGPGPVGSSRPDAGSRPGDIRPTEANENEPNVNAGGFGTAEPSVSADPASGQKPEAEQQGADKPLDKPTGEQAEAVKETKEQADDEQRHPSSEQERQEMAEKGELPKDPNDHSGEPMKMHGADPIEEAGKEGEGGETDRKKSVGQEGGAPHGSEKGTGEEWVKTSGFEKDGGDFDATKPGAGKEATRLQEEKGIHHEAGATGPVTTEADGTTTKEKVSKLDKFKEKLHIGTGKNLDS